MKFYSTFLFCAFSFLMSVQTNIRSLPTSTCSENDFTISIQLTQVNGLEVTFIYQLFLRTPDVLTIGNLTINDYMQTCITNIVVIGKQVKPEQENISYIEKIKIINTTITTFFNQFTTLKPLTSYNFLFGYEQKQKDNQTIILNSTVIDSCFGIPGKPLNLRQKLLEDGGVILEWNEPDEIGAPFLCYYLVEKNIFMNSTREKINSLYYIVDKSELLNRPQLRISTYNEAYCYEEEFSFVKSCKPNITSDSSVWIRVDGNLIEATSTMTARTPILTSVTSEKTSDFSSRVTQINPLISTSQFNNSYTIKKFNIFSMINLFCLAVVFLY